MRKAVLLILLAAALVAGGCGDDNSDSNTAAATATDAEAAEEAANVSPQQALDEIGAVRQGLANSLAAYRAGDAAQADTLAGDAYLEHFELVEGPLGQRDEELNEELEEQIREELRSKIQQRAPVGEVQALIKKIYSELDEAEQKLGS